MGVRCPGSSAVERVTCILAGKQGSAKLVTLRQEITWSGVRIPPGAFVLMDSYI